ncbi:MAG: hypothetical protein WAM71_09760 [Candidatus Korobacteraceae bacterium]
MDRVARREVLVLEHDLLGSFHYGGRYWEYFINDTEQRIEGRLDCGAAVDGHVTMEYFLQDLSVCNQPLLPS